jgi:ribosome-binding protein aMBF1 (putative translation factor)
MRTIQPQGSRKWAVLGLEEAMSAAGMSYEQLAAETGYPVRTLKDLAAGRQRAHTITISTLRRTLGPDVRRGW